MKISIVIPIYNEEKNLKTLFGELDSVKELRKYEIEIIAVNDGSRDNSFEVLKNIAQRDSRVKVLNFSKNFGQTAAINAGIYNSSGDLVILIDGDLENDPADIPKLIKKANEGYDVVSGWRKKRWKKSFFTRKLPSVVANAIISKFTKISLHDYGCTLKIYRRAVIENVHLYGEMHRFIPVYASMEGANVAEVVVNYRPRRYGKSNYGMKRTFKVILDLFTVVFMLKYFSRPMHFFGKFGFFLLFGGFVSGAYAIFLKFFKSTSFISTPLPLLTVVFIIIGILFLLMGLLAEILIRIYYANSNNHKSYLIKDKINF